MATRTDDATPTRSTQSRLRSVALPTEHGGWGLTAEPVVLGLAIAPSWAGVLVGLAALVAFVARAPLRVILVDHHRERDLDRTRLARRAFLAESVLLVVLVGGAIALGGVGLLWPVLVAAPLVVVQLWFDMRSRSRRLLPELLGSVGICSVATMIALAGGAEPAIAVGAWFVLAARALCSIPQVRAQVDRIHGRPASTTPPLLGDLAAVVLAGIAVALDVVLAAGAVAVLVVVVAQRVAIPALTSAKVIGVCQTIIGLVIVVVTALGVHLI